MKKVYIDIFKKIASCWRPKKQAIRINLNNQEIIKKLLL